MLGKDTTALCLHMDKQARENRILWLAMGKIKVLNLSYTLLVAFVKA